jgi:hypothetical protein
MEAGAGAADDDAGAPPHVIVLLHGIRTHGSWAEMVVAVLESTCDAKVIPVRYGYFDAFRFLFPLFTRRAGQANPAGTTGYSD